MMHTHSLMMAASLAALSPNALQPVDNVSAIERSGSSGSGIAAAGPDPIVVVDDRASYPPAAGRVSPGESTPDESVASVVDPAPLPGARAAETAKGGGGPGSGPLPPWNPYVEDLGAKVPEGRTPAPQTAGSGWMRVGYRLVYAPPSEGGSAALHGRAGPPVSTAPAEPLVYGSRYRPYVMPVGLGAVRRAADDPRAEARRSAAPGNGYADRGEAPGGFGFRGFGLPAVPGADPWDGGAREFRFGTFRWSLPWSRNGGWGSGDRDGGGSWASGLPRFRLGSFGFPEDRGRWGWLDGWGDERNGDWLDAGGGCLLGDRDEGGRGFRFGPFRMPERFTDWVDSGCRSTRHASTGRLCGLDGEGDRGRSESPSIRRGGVVAGVDYPVEFALGGMGGAGYADAGDGIDDLDGRLRRIEHQLKIIIALLGRIGLGG